MKDPAVAARAMQDRYRAQARSLNELVDRLLAEYPDRWLPYIDPDYAGDHAEVLLLLQDPGKKTDPAEGGSGFVSSRNDDPSAGRLRVLLSRAGLSTDRVVAWNAYPWRLRDGRKPTAAERADGRAVLARVLDRLPRLRAVVTLGSEARDGWVRLTAERPDLRLDQRYLRHHTLHTSGRGITGGTNHTAELGEAKVLAVFGEVLGHLNATNTEIGSGAIGGEAPASHPSHQQP